MSPLSRLLITITFMLFATSHAPSAIAAEPSVTVRPLHLRIAEAAQPVRLTRVHVDVLVVGRSARTTIELTFHNPNPRVLEGELQFPLLEGQQVTGFALDLDGQWRTAVPINKARGQEVFEEIARAQVDPALLETTQGNNYRLRVYPLPPLGQRKVSLSVQERLPTRPDGTSVWRLPLAFAGKLEHFDLHLQVPGLRGGAVNPPAGFGAVHWQEEDNGATLVIRRSDFRPPEVIEIPLLSAVTTPSTVEDFAGQRYFYTEVEAPRSFDAKRPKPAALALVWDASGSGAARDHGKEFALLDAYFRGLGNTRVALTLARNEREDGGVFVIKGGDWSTLRTALEKVVYDGGTSLGAMLPAGRHDAILLFSDALGNFAASTMPDFTVPVFAVSAATGSDHGRLRSFAERSGGVYVDLLITTPMAGATVLQRMNIRLDGIAARDASDLVTSTLDPEGRRIALAGILQDATGHVTLHWRHPNGKVERQSIVVGARAAMPGRFAAQAWAGLRLAQLLPERSRQQAAIERLGKEFALVTPGTSLLVLDRVEDYVRYEIIPPPELRAEYDRLLTARRQTQQHELVRHLEDIARRFQEKQAWWAREFPKGERPQPRPDARIEVQSLGLAGSPAPGNRPQPAAAPAPVPASAETRLAVAKAASPQREAAREMDRTEPVSTPASPGRIQLRKWAPGSAYGDRLRSAQVPDLYRIYLEERPMYRNSTAFFLDVADIFFERGEDGLALRILSNLAEMEIDNRQLLRILAYRLLQAKRADLAVPLLQHVTELAPNEPQSWRDLGLAQAAVGARQQAIEALYQVVTRPWHNRFPDIELIALAEMNALMATANEKLDLSSIDPRFVRNLPLDLRVVLSWDVDNTDIDLWVTDPNGEKTYYGNRLSYQGGAMSRDFTGGYGPEEFSLKRAKPGRYLIEAQFYGHRQQVIAGATTLNVRIYSAFGTLAQKEEQITLRLRGQSERVTVGEFVVGH